MEVLTLLETLQEMLDRSSSIPLTKKSLVDKAPGDYWQKMAQFRLLCTYQMTLPGKKLTGTAHLPLPLKPVQS